MSKLRRTLSQRYKKRSYSTLPPETDMFKTPPSKITPLKQVSRRSLSNRNAATTSTPLSKQAVIQTGKENSDQQTVQRNNNKSGAFAGLSSVKTAIINIGQVCFLLTIKSCDR